MHGVDAQGQTFATAVFESLIIIGVEFDRTRPRKGRMGFRSIERHREGQIRPSLQTATEANCSLESALGYPMARLDQKAGSSL